jgi:DNA polymerase-1
MAHLLDPNKSTKLKILGNRYLGSNSDDWEQRKNEAFAKGKWNWATVPVTLPEYWTYSCMDTILTARLHEYLFPRLTGKLLDIYEMEIAIEHIIMDQEMRGIAVDLPYSIEQRAVYLKAADELEQWCMATYNHLSMGSTKGVAAQLQRDGIVLTKITDHGAWSVDEDVLKNIDHPLAKGVLSRRKALKFANAYFGNYVDMSYEGRLHCSVNTLGAKTGRMSVSRPALQQIPRLAVLRNAFIPSPGNRLVSVDYDQIEMRLFAHYTQDPDIIAAFAADGDFFINSANKMYGLDIQDKGYIHPGDKEPLRAKLKTLSYGLIYGEGAKKFAEVASIPVEEAYRMRAEYLATFKSIQPFMDSINLKAQQSIAEFGESLLFTPLGRREVSDNDKTYALVNYLVQGSAADIYKQALIELDRHNLLDYFVLPIHDEVLLDVPVSEAEEIGAEVAKVMYRDDFTVPLTGGCEVLERWGAKYG